MQTLFLWASLLAVFLFMGCLISSLDKFLSGREGTFPGPDGQALRIGFSQQAEADWADRVLGRCCRPVPAYFIQGSAPDLMRGLSQGNLHLVILPRETPIPLGVQWNVVQVRLPAAGGQEATHNVLWQEGDCSGDVLTFLDKMEIA